MRLFSASAGASESNSVAGVSPANAKISAIVHNVHIVAGSHTQKRDGKTVRDHRVTQKIKEDMLRAVHSHSPEGVPVVLAGDLNITDPKALHALASHSQQRQRRDATSALDRTCARKAQHLCLLVRPHPRSSGS